MNILSLAEYQRDKYAKKIIDDSLSDYKLAARKHLELQVKLSSLAQETNCYKYWIDNKSELNHDVIFEKYIDFLNYRDESQECFVNKNGEIIAIVDMLSLPQYLFYSLFYTKTNDVDFGKEDYFRLYPKKAKGLTFVDMNDLSTDYKEGYTLGDLLKK
mgnify:CR=1 FL=1